MKIYMFIKIYKTKNVKYIKNQLYIFENIENNEIYQNKALK